MAQFVGYSGPLWLFPEVVGSQVTILFLVRFFVRKWKQKDVELNEFSLWILKILKQNKRLEDAGPGSSLKESKLCIPLIQSISF